MINDFEDMTTTHLAIQPKPLLERLCVVPFLPVGFRPTTWPFGLPLAVVGSIGRPFASAAIAECWSCVVATVSWGKGGMEDKRWNVFYSVQVS